MLLTDSQSDIIIHRYSLDHLAPYIVQLGRIYSRAVLISTPHVFSLYGQKIKDQFQKIRLPITEILIPEGEEAKILTMADNCWEKMAALQMDRSSLVVGLGGGVVTDLAGFVASCYMRGIDAVFLPTTLMAMVDASIGGKTGVNLGPYKNYIGSFYAPRLIVIDPNCLLTLPDRELSAGLAEMIKYGIISDIDLFESLEKHIDSLRRKDLILLEEFIYRSCKVKCHIVQQDPKDQHLSVHHNIRSFLNYGHTFAHAIEGLTHYQDYLHGEAVAIGMSCAAHLSYQINETDQTLVKRQDLLCQRAGLPIQFPSTIAIDQLIKVMKGDKKSVGGKISLILPQKIGKVFRFSNIEPDLIRQTLLTKDMGPLERT